ncbi:MAG: lysophospholipid acyltransferase family protein [Gammaproteobacteria bacterium]
MRKLTLKSIAAIPLPILYSISKPLYILLYYIVRYRRSIAENNIRNSFPKLNDTEVQTLLKLHYRNFCDVMVEMLKTINLKPTQLNNHVSFRNHEVIEDTLESGQTIILALAHQCNMEWATIAASQQLNFPIDGIYKPLHQKWLNELTIESRSQYGITLLPAKTCITDLIKRAKQTRIIAIAPDQAPRRRDEAYWTTFLNQETPFYLGLEKIATLFKYPVFFMDVERTSRGQYLATFKPLTQPPYEKDSSSVSKAYVEAVEEQILNQPEDWLWIHKRWKKKKSLYE